MQFNPACLQGSGNMSTMSNTATVATTPAEFANNPNPSNSYPDGPPQNGNPWGQQSSVLGLPVYGIYNASLIPVPEAVPNQASDNAPAKKKSAKRSPQQKSDNMVLDDSAKAEDKFQGLDEEQKQKRQRRLIKNREAAQQFRQRQKEYIQNLERRVTELNSHVGETHKHIELLTAENRLLRDQLVYLYNVMRQNLSLTSPSPLSPTASSPTFTSQLPSSVPPSPSIPPTPPPSPISPFSGNMSLPASNAMASALSSPTQMLDLSMLGFKGYNMMSDGSISYEMLKTATTAQGMNMQNIPQQHIPQHMQTMQNMQNIPQNLTHSLAQNLQALQNIQNMNQSAQQLQQMTLATPTSSAQNSPVSTPTSPTHLSNIDLGTLKLDMDNAMLLSRYSKMSDPNEAQTVPVFVKSEGTASL